MPRARGCYLAITETIMHPNAPLSALWQIGLMAALGAVAEDVVCDRKSSETNWRKYYRSGYVMA